MPTIRPYVAPDRTLRPEAEGFAAFETAGRRVGALYNEAGEDYRRIGALMAQQITDKRWPFDILELEKAQEAAQRARAGSGGGGRVRVSGLNSNTSAEDPLGFYRNRDFSVHDQISSGMAALGDYVGNQNYRPASGTQLNTTGPQVIDLTNGTMSIGNKTAIGTDFGAGGGMTTGVGSGADYAPGAITSEILPGSYGSPPSPGFFSQADQYGANINPQSTADTTPQGWASSAADAVSGAASSFVQGLGDWYSSAVGANATGSDSGAGTAGGF